MKIVVTTIYENVDQKWLDWYLGRLASADEMPSSTKLVENLKKYRVASFSSKDPESDIVGTTRYYILDEGE